MLQFKMITFDDLSFELSKITDVELFVRIFKKDLDKLVLDPHVIIDNEDNDGEVNGEENGEQPVKIKNN